MRKFLGFVAIVGLAGSLQAGKGLPGQPGEETVPGQVIVRLKQGAPPGLLRALLGPQVSSRQVNSKLDLHLVEVAEAVGLAIASHPLIRYVEPNRIRRSQVAAPTDPYYSASQYALQNVQALAAWRMFPNRYLTAATAGTGRIRVAVLDTGADCTHPDFKNSGGASTDSAFGGQLNWSLSQALVPTMLFSPACPWQDDNGHGTHTAGTVAAATNNSLGVASLGYPLELVIYKVLDSSGMGDDVTVADAIVRATDAGASVISMSLGGPGYSQALQDAITYACERNVAVIAAAGNSSSSSLFFPAGAYCVAGVAATDSSNNRASFSNFGNSIDIAAPGVSVLSTYPSASYAFGSGTSMATPHVAALAGLVVMSTPGLPAAAALQRIQQTAASSTANGGWQQYIGYGVIDAQRAIGGPLRSASVGSIAGQVVDDTGDPVVGALVTVNGQNTTTGAGGFFRFANLPAGAYVATASASGFPTEDQTVVVGPGADSPLSFQLGVSLGVFTGAVKDGSTPVASAIVQAVADGVIAGTSVSDAAGLYTLAVPPGTYDLRASGVSRLTTILTGQTVTAGGTLTVDLSLPKLGWVAGTVTDGSQNPIPNAQITVTGNGFSAGAVTDSSGSYATIGLPSGAYAVSASADGWQEQTINGVAISLGSASSVNFGLGTVTVSVSPASVTLAGSQAQQFTATVTGSADQSVTWSRSPALGTISAAGLYTAPSSFTNHTLVTITATSVANPTRSGSATVTLDNVLKLTLSPTSVVGGVSTTANKITLDDPAPAGGAVVSLTSSDPAVAAPPASVTVAEGATVSPSFTISTSWVSAATPVTIRATYAGVTKAATLTVNPVALSSVSPASSSVAGGDSLTTNHVTLNGPAPPDGAVVMLTSSNPAVASLPASVTVAAGQTASAHYTITTTWVSANTPVTITGSYAGSTKTAVLTVKPVVVYSVTLSPSSVGGGGTTTSNKVSLDAPAPPGGAVVTLSSDSPAASPPSTVAVAEGAENSPYFTITTTPVESVTSVTITASYGGVSKSATLTVNPTALSSLTLSPSSVTGGLSSTYNKVTLNGPAGPSGAAVSLTSSNPAVASPPASVTVAAGTTTSAYFAITTTPVAAATQVTITASYGSVSKSATLTVKTTALSSLSLSSSSVTGGVSTTSNKVTLTGPAVPGGVVVALASSNPAVASVPASVTVAAGATVSPYFTLATTQVATVTQVTITASYGSSSKSATLTVKPTALSSLYLSASSVTGGASTTSNKVTLTGPAAAGGVVVSLASSNPAVASVPASVTVAAGATTSAYFTITTTPVAIAAQATITASYAGASKSATLTVNPPSVSSLSLYRSSVKGGGSTVSNKVYLNGPAPSGGVVVSLASSNAAVATPPASVTVAAGATISPYFTITTTSVTSSTAVTITATYGASKSAVLTVYP
jgi:subtilisin family serine protease